MVHLGWLHAHVDVVDCNLTLHFLYLSKLQLPGLPPLVALYEVPDDDAASLPAAAVSPRSVPAAWAAPLRGCMGASSSSLSSNSDASSMNHAQGGTTIPELFIADAYNNATSTGAPAVEDASLIFAACGGSRGQRLLQALRTSTGQVQWRLRVDTTAPLRRLAPSTPRTASPFSASTSTGGLGVSSTGWTKARRRSSRRDGKLPMRRAEGAAARALGHNGLLAVWAEAQSTVDNRYFNRITPFDTSLKSRTKNHARTLTRKRTLFLSLLSRVPLPARGCAPHRSSRALAHRRGGEGF